MFSGFSLKQKFSIRHLNQQNTRVLQGSGRILAEQLVALKSCNENQRKAGKSQEATIFRNSWGSPRLITR